MCVCVVPTRLPRSCGNFIILSWNTCSRLTPFFSYFFFSFPSLTALICSVDHVTLSPYPSPCAKLLFLQPFFFFLCPFFPVGLCRLSLSLSFSVSYVYIFSQTYLRFLTNTHVLLSRPLRLLPFSIFECSVIIIILTCV